MLRNILFIFLISLTHLWAMNPFLLESGENALKLAPNSQWLIYNKTDAPGLYLLNLSNAKAFKIAQGFGLAQFAQWAPNSDYIGFKLFEQNAQTILQIPCLFDVRQSKIIPLHSPVLLAGVPSVAANGTVVFTVDKQLLVTDLNGNTTSTFTLPDYANLTPISPDGHLVVFNDRNDRLWLLDLTNGKRIVLSGSEQNGFNPQWNPHKPLLVFQTFNGYLHLFDVEAQREIFQTPGTNPSWSTDGSKLVFARQQIIETQEVQSSELFLYDLAKAQTVRLTDTPDSFENYPALASDGTLFFTEQSPSQNGLYHQRFFAPQTHEPLLSPGPRIKVRIKSTSEIAKPDVNGFLPKATESTAYSFDMPYVHQCFDSPTWFNGCTACGGTAATMCIAYYHILPKRPRTVYDPYTHITNYGDYIAEIYSYHGFTFDIWAYDRNGVKGYGAFGYIVRNGSEAWADTKGNMASYARKHGLYSYVDWNPTRDKLMTEANAKRPFVLLNSITSAGHYISVIGYDKNATTVIVNDPAGDKSLGHYGANYQGKGARYDWPGYSNGHPNLNRVWCFIYFRDKCADLVSRLTQAPDTLTAGQDFVFKGFVTNAGNNPGDSTKAFVFLSQNQTFDASNDWILDSLQIPVLAPKDTAQLNLVCSLNDSLISSYYYLGLFVQTKERTNEAYLSNNTVIKKIAVKGYPAIYRTLPRGEITDRMPTVKGSFFDMFSAIDLAEIHLFLDGQDVTGQSQINTSSAMYQPDDSLDFGLHQVELSVRNALGLQSKYQWEFTINETTGFGKEFGALPAHLQLSSNYPNPFNNRTRFDFSLPKPTFVRAALFDIRGQKIRTLLQTQLAAGTHHLFVDGDNLASGIYFVRMQAGQEIKVKRILLIK